ncbi:class I SAM-dependent methyltransferase [Streptomyces sp. NPDC005820]|uniref:class I SAM-dependent methyltransferase n=1 Tax=Streptomyces sp. NPDC005820 TaxID=3157069 RepID=UPI0034095BEE
MSESSDAAQADRALKAKHRALWALGDYPLVATDVVPDLGPVLVRESGVRPGTRVLDVAAGSGNAAIPAALVGAEVVAVDLTPELLEAGRHLAEERGAELEWREGDAEQLPFPAADFDTVVSCVGVMFTPHHQQAADELVRVCRPGGTIGLINWTPEGFVGQMFTAMRPYAPPPPPGAQPAPLWGDESHVRALLGDRVSGIDARRRMLRVDRFSRPEEFREFFKACYGPTVAVYGSLADDPDKVTALDTVLTDLAAQHLADGAMDWEYLLVTADKNPG